jgi:hypothetical protein
METANAVLDVVSASEFDGISGTPQYYHVNDRGKLQGGVINNSDLSPDLVVLHKRCQATEERQTTGELRPPKEIHWANALHVLEIKSRNTAICDGERIPRLIIDSKHVSSSLWRNTTDLGDRDRSTLEPRAFHHQAKIAQDCSP